MNFVYSFCQNARKIQGHLEKRGLLFLRSTVIIPDRNTFILKRKHPPGLVKKGGKPLRFRRRHFIYELEEDTYQRPDAPLDLILTSSVEGVGQKGDRVNVRRVFGYNELLLQGLAEYATPESLETIKTEAEDEKETKFSSHYVPLILPSLSNFMLTVLMNKETPWILEPWHIRASFRQAGFHMEDSSIEMPTRKIQGPSNDLEMKTFFVTVTINNKEKVKVRCCIHHWSTNIIDRLPHVQQYWNLPLEAVFPDEATELKTFPAAKPTPVE